MSNASNSLQDVQLLKAIASGDRTALHQVYLQHRGSFLGWACNRYSCTEEDAADLYQDAVIVLYENALAGKIDGKSKLRTYLFGVGRNLILKNYEHYKRFADNEVGEALDLREYADAVDQPIMLNERQKMLQTALRELGEACRRLLIRFYYDRHSTEAIMAEFGYKTKDVVKSQKARCMRGLRNMLQDKGEFLM
ncbi:MAG: sigma-70 family RNA polymerase sigma factor [Bacteroidia bacterium]